MNRMRHSERSPLSQREIREGDPDRIAAMCVGKEGLTWVQAKAILDRTPRKGRTKTAYHCPVCKAWHLGSPMRKRKRWKAR